MCVEGEAQKHAKWKIEGGRVKEAPISLLVCACSLLQPVHWELLLFTHSPLEEGEYVVLLVTAFWMDGR